MRLLRVSVLVCSVAIPKGHSPESQSVAEARSVSRLCDRVTRRASPGLDTDLSGLGLGFIYPGNVRRKGLVAGHAFQPSRVTVRSHIKMSPFALFTDCHRLVTLCVCSS